MPDARSRRTGRLSAAVAGLQRAIEWLKRRERSVLLAAAGFQVLVLLAMIGLHALPLLAGETILVRVVPVDPRDLFRGDYVVLGYEFSVIPPEGIEGLPADLHRRDAREWQGRTVYVSLVPEEDGKHWRSEKVSIHQPSSGKYIRGRIAGSGRLEFGIEAFYLQEGRGLEYEEAIRDQRLSAAIAVTSNGEAALRDLRIEALE
jgi:uncharacterized membrane-anchored protein